MKELARKNRMPLSQVQDKEVFNIFPVLKDSDDELTNLAEYIAGNRETIENDIFQNGAVLFRGFNVKTTKDFFNSIYQLSPDILNYSERSSPRHEVSDRVYTSTDHPSDQTIMQHSEQSYTYNWPVIISFYCQKKAEVGGDTPIASNRGILQTLPDELVDKLRKYGVLYQRNYQPGVGLGWKESFQTELKSEVEMFCAKRDIEVLWKPDGSLRTRQVRSAFQRHPFTQEEVWFNHCLFFHVSSLDEQISSALVEAVGYDNVPTNTFFGNGERFSDDEIFAMRKAVDQEIRRFSWEEGDVLILDNMLCQHGRDPFSGDRSIYTLMAKQYESFLEPIKKSGTEIL